MQATERVRDGLRAVVAIGTPVEVRRFLATARRLGTLVEAERPVPAGRGRLQVRAVLWAAGPPVRVSRDELPPAGPVRWSPPPWLTGRVAWRAGAVAAGLGALGLVCRGLLSAAAWTGEHGGQIVGWLIVAAAGTGLVAALTVRGGRQGRGRVHHCPGCPHGGARG